MVESVMRIALIAPPWVPVPPRYYGGTELVIDLLARGYQRAGHDVRLFATGDSACPVSTQWVYDRAQGQRINSIEPELRQALEGYAAVGDCDIVHDHTLAGPLLAERFTDKPVVATVHGPFDGERSVIFDRLGPRTHTVAISESQRREAPHLRVARVIHHGIEAETFPFRAEPEDYCLFIGRMDPDKGAGRAIEASRAAGLPLKLAGKMRTADERAYFEEEVAPHLGDTVEYLGEVDHGDKLDLMARARATLFPIAWSEPFGLVMLESMACGTPVLAMPVGAVPEVVADGVTGYLCPDAESMAGALGKLDAIDRRTCRAAVEGYFSADRMVADYLDLFATLLAA